VPWTLFNNFNEADPTAMKIWNAYGSEHSMNLVMIGRFKDAGAAEAAKDAIEELQEYFRAQQPDGLTYSDDVMEIFRRREIHSIGPAELEQFQYDVRVRATRSKLVLSTDEPDVSAYWKILIDRGAKVELFSAHDYPEEGDGKE
jgi:hypothetical protein